MENWKVLQVAGWHMRPTGFHLPTPLIDSSSSSAYDEILKAWKTSGQLRE